MTLAEGFVVSRYRVVAPLGAGQMGEVFRAVGPNGEEVAIKVMRPGPWGGDRELLARFRREASLSSTILHPNVVVVFEHGDIDGSPYLVMPLFHGEDFGSALERTGPLRPDVATSLVRQAALGLDAAHTNGVIHRDLKPANLFLDERDGEIVTVVCDFGIAKVLAEDAGITASGAVLGTPMYMAPEQLLDAKRVTPRCDVWALGMTLYHALAGRPAFEHVSSMAELLIALKRCDVPPLQSLAPWVQPGLARVVHAALLPAEDRLPSARAFLDALAQWAPPPVRVTKADLVSLPSSQRTIHAASAPGLKSASELGAPSDDTVQDSGAPSGSTDPFIGRVLAERYRIVAPLGTGGMGAVYEAIDIKAPSSNDPAVALKIMHPEVGARSVDQTRRFLREAKASQRVQHLHVTRVVDTGVDAGANVPFLVMERLRGSDLGHLIAERSTMLAPNVAVTLFVQACEGLAAAHTLGIVHRDIKPSNLFVHEAGGVVTVKVCDFGIAKQLADAGVEASAELTHTGGILGSPLYMSPEQAKSAKTVDARSDIYSLALSLHETLSGRRPWPGATSMGEIILAVCTEDVPPLEQVAPWVDPNLAQAIARGLARDREQRWASVADFARALRPFALNRLLTTADLRLLPRPVISSPSPSATMGVSRTADPVAYTDSSAGVSASRSPARWPLVLGGAALLAAIATGGAIGMRRMTATPPSPPPPAEKEAIPIAPAPAPVPVPVPVASSAEPVTPSASAPIAVKPPKPIVVSPKPPALSAPAPAASAPPSNVGRGGTATDLPGL